MEHPYKPHKKVRNHSFIEFDSIKPKTKEQCDNFSLESKMLKAKLKQNILLGDKKSFLDEKTLLENLLHVTEAELFVPLQIYYKLFQFFHENQKILDKNPKIHQIWNDLQTQLLYEGHVFFYFAAHDYKM